jgi:hypothetical protein
VLAIFALVTAGVLPALGPMIGAVSMLVAALYFAVMRVNVTPQSVEIRYGNLRPSIPVTAITSTEVVSLDAISKLAVGIEWEGPGSGGTFHRASHRRCASHGPTASRGRPR